MRKFLLTLIAVLACLVVSPFYFWNAKKTVAEEARGKYGYNIQMHRFRPIAAFEFERQSNVYRTDRWVFGGTTILAIERVRWLGRAEAVAFDLQVLEDSGPRAQHRLFYDFDAGTLITTLKYPMTPARFDELLANWTALHPE